MALRSYIYPALICYVIAALLSLITLRILYVLALSTPVPFMASSQLTAGPPTKAPTRTT